MNGWIATKDRLPEEDYADLVFTDGTRQYRGYYDHIIKRFVEVLPAGFEGGAATEWTPEGIIGWAPPSSDGKGTRREGRR